MRPGAALVVVTAVDVPHVGAARGAAGAEVAVVADLVVAELVLAVVAVVVREAAVPSSPRWWSPAGLGRRQRIALMCVCVRHTVSVNFWSAEDSSRVLPLHETLTFNVIAAPHDLPHHPNRYLGSGALRTIPGTKGPCAHDTSNG